MHYIRTYWMNLKPFGSPIGATICFVTTDEGLIGGQKVLLPTKNHLDNNGKF